MVSAKREAYQQEQHSPQERLREQERSWERESKREATRKVRSANKQIGIGRQVGLVFFVLSVATVCLALVGGYERLAVAHRANVSLKEEIRQAETYVEDLSVELEYAMDPITVQSIASKRLGMNYPKQEQLVKVEAPALPVAVEPTPTQAPATPAPQAPPTPEPSFAMPEVERAFQGEDFEILGIEE